MKVSSLIIAEPILAECFPKLQYTAGLLGYGSDVLGYDDNTSTDHMWGPRFCLFVDKNNFGKKHYIAKTLSEKLSYTYKGFSANFDSPRLEDKGVRHPEHINDGGIKIAAKPYE